MSATNYFETRRKAFELRTIAVTADYTVRVGGASDGFVADRVLDVTTTSGTNIAITLPDGVYEGQRVLINFTSEGNAETVTVTPDTAATTASYALTAEGDYCSLEWFNSTEGWNYLSEVTT